MRDLAPGYSRAVKVSASVASPAAPIVYRWLLGVYAAVVLMVAIGGVTRLTGSGLSIVEWQPIRGALPPLSDADWQQLFEAYQQSPQYRQVNQGMSLVEFRRIFFWEYVHRLVGRLVGLAVVAPWLWFVLRRRIDAGFALKTLLVLVLGGLQGALGWLMVQSGLVDVPAVSHYRLAAHLLLAFLLALYVFGLALQVRLARVWAGERAVRTASIAVAALVLLQIVYGAFMAGTRAGYAYGTFPTLNGEWLPTGSWALEPGWRNLVENPLTIHFVHRTLGYVCTAVVAAFSWWLMRRAITPAQRRAARWPLLLITLQLVTGIATVVFGVPLVIAVLHQVLGLWLVTSVLWAQTAWVDSGRSAIHSAERPNELGVRSRLTSPGPS